MYNGGNLFIGVPRYYFLMARSGIEPLGDRQLFDIGYVSSSVQNTFAPRFSPSIPRPTKIRKDFAEAWIYDSFSTGGGEMLVAK